MLADSGMKHLAPHAKTALDGNYIRPSKRIFDNSKVSDHFAIIPTLQAPSGLSEAEQKLYDLVVRRFLAVFFPSAEFTVTTRITSAVGHHFKTEGKVLVKPGWMAVYGKEAAEDVTDAKEGDKGQNLVPVREGETVRAESVEPKALKTKPPARYSEATLLGAMEGAGKLVDDDELRLAMQEKGLGTPATRAATIEGLLTEKYMLREGREMIPTAKAFQLMTLLRGLGVQELSKAELTGEWEYKLSQMEHGQAQPRRVHGRHRRHDRAHGDEGQGIRPRHHPRQLRHAGNALPQLRWRGERKLPPLHLHRAKTARAKAVVSRLANRQPGAPLSPRKPSSLLANKHIGPLEGFRSKAGWPFVAEIVIKFNEEDKNWKLEFDFGDDKKNEESGEIVDFTGSESLGACPICGSPVYEHGSNYVCSKTVPTEAQPTPSCTFKSGKIILQQPIEREQMQKLLANGKTDLLDKFVSMRTRRSFKAFLAWDAEAGKVNFAFEPRTSKFPPRKTAAGAPAKTAAAKKAAPAKKARGQKDGRRQNAQGASQDHGSQRQAAQRRLDRRDRRRPGVAARGHEEALGLHQGAGPAGRGRQAQDQRRCQAGSRVWQAAGDDVRDRQTDRPASELRVRPPRSAASRVAAPQGRATRLGAARRRVRCLFFLTSFGNAP